MTQSFAAGCQAQPSCTVGFCRGHLILTSASPCYVQNSAGRGATVCLALYKVRLCRLPLFGSLHFLNDLGQVLPPSAFPSVGFGWADSRHPICLKCHYSPISPLTPGSSRWGSVSASPLSLAAGCLSCLGRHLLIPSVRGVLRCHQPAGRHPALFNGQSHDPAYELSQECVTGPSLPIEFPQQNGPSLKLYYTILLSYNSCC